MKRLKIVFILLFVTTVVLAQVYTISTQRFTRPLVEKWVEDYKKVAPNIHFQIQKGCGNIEESDLCILPFDKDVEDAPNVVVFARYAILPFTAKGSEAEQIYTIRNSPINVCAIFSLNTRTLPPMRN